MKVILLKQDVFQSYCHSVGLIVRLSKKRLLAIANYNNDLSEYWEFSDTGMFPLDMSNEADKLGVNYIIYALTR